MASAIPFQLTGALLCGVVAASAGAVFVVITFCLKMTLDWKRFTMCVCTFLYGLLLCIRWVLVLTSAGGKVQLWMSVSGLCCWMVALAVLCYFWCRVFVSEVAELEFVQVGRVVRIVRVVLICIVLFAILSALIILVALEIVSPGQVPWWQAIPLLVLLGIPVMFSFGVLYFSYRLSAQFFRQYRETGVPGKLTFSLIMVGSNTLLTVTTLAQCAAAVYFQYLNLSSSSIPASLPFFVFGVSPSIATPPVLVLVLFAAVLKKIAMEDQAELIGKSELSTPLSRDVPSNYDL